MKECKSWLESIEKYLTGEIEAEELSLLREHSRDCPNCRDLLAAHDELLRIDDLIPKPSEREFRAMRLGVMAQVSTAESVARNNSFWQDTLMLLRGHPGVLFPLAAMALIAALLLGRWSVGPGEFDESGLMRELVAQASVQQGLDDYFDQPLVYSNVSVKPQSDGTLAMSFDIARHVEVEAPLESPLARTVLLWAMLNPSRMGSRMQAMEVSMGVIDPRLRDALVLILHTDPSLAVRLEALNTLSAYPPEQTINNAMLKTLQNDQSVQMRLSALDLLAGRSVNPQIIQETIKQIPLDGDAVLFQRALELQKTL